MYALLSYRTSSNLSELNNILLITDQLYTALWLDCCLTVSAEVDIPLPTLISSAKDYKVSTTSLPISPIRTRKRRGPRTEPWGTPDIYDWLGG